MGTDGCFSAATIDTRTPGVGLLLSDTGQEHAP
jgi:hypothetical protein